MNNSTRDNIARQEEISSADILNDPLLADPDAVDTGTKSPVDGLSDEMQLMLVGNIIHNLDCMRVAASLLPAKSFCQLSHKVALEIAYDYYENYGTLIPKPFLMELAKEKTKSWKNNTYIISGIAALEYLPFHTPAYWQDRIREMAERTAIANATMEFHKDGDFQKFYKAVDEARRPKTADIILYSPSELADLPPMEWAIAGHFPKRSTVCIFGPSGSLKTFYCLDMAFSLASGERFLNTWDVTRSKILYINSEGSYNLQSRLAAFRHGKRLASDIDDWLMFSTISHNLQDRGEVDRLLDVASKRLGRIDAMFIDTLSRNFGVGDTDKNADMQQYLRQVDYIRERTGAAVANIHHTGWGNEDRERGAKSLRDYCDSSIRICKCGDQIEVACVKQKDAAEFATYLLNKKVAAGSLYLELAGEKQEVKAEANEAELLGMIPDLDLDTVESDRNTVSPEQIRDKTHWSNAKIGKMLKSLMDSGRIHRVRFGDSRSPFKYYQRTQL